MITLHSKGDFSKTYKFFEKCKELVGKGDFNKYGQRGVEALKSATPVDSGMTAQSWDYKIKSNKNGMSIVWTNSNVNDGVPIAILIQYGHATRGGTYVQGLDFINPAIRPVFDEIAEEVWKEVTR